MSRPRTTAGALAVLLALSGPACARRGPSAASRPSVVALVGDRPVEFADYAAYVKAASGEDPKTVSPRVASSLLDQYLDERLLDRAVEDAAPPASGETPAAKRRDLIARRAAIAAIPEEHLRREYDAHPERWRKPPLFRLSQMLFGTADAAEGARRRLATGGSWDAISRESSRAPNAATGGPLGAVAVADLPAHFAKAVAATPAGGITPVLQAPHGFHLFRVDERLFERTIPFEEAAPALRLSLATERSAAALEAILDASRTRYPPRVLEEHLPFPYVGTTARFSLDSK